MGTDVLGAVRVNTMNPAGQVCVVVCVVVYFSVLQCVLFQSARGCAEGCAGRHHRFR